MENQKSLFFDIQDDWFNEETRDIKHIDRIAEENCWKFGFRKTAYKGFYKKADRDDEIWKVVEEDGKRYLVKVKADAVKLRK